MDKVNKVINELPVSNEAKEELTHLVVLMVNSGSKLDAIKARHEIQGFINCLYFQKVITRAELSNLANNISEQWKYVQQSYYIAESFIKRASNVR